jgi:hypothetical protein
MYEINETHDPNLESWVESANDPSTDFPIQNLPFCLFWSDSSRSRSVGVVIGDFVLDLAGCAEDDLLREDELSEPDPSDSDRYVGGNEKELFVRTFRNFNWLQDWICCRAFGKN